MRYLLISVLLVILSPTLHAGEDDDNAKKCAEILRETRTAYSPEELKILIGEDLGVGPYPAELRRDYLREGQVVVSLSLVVTRPRGYANSSRRLVLNAENLPEDKLSSFYQLMTKDIEAAASLASLDPVKSSDDEIRKLFASKFHVNSGYRHSMTAEEAQDLFSLVNSLLSLRLDGTQPKDVIVRGRPSIPEIGFVKF